VGDEVEAELGVSAAGAHELRGVEMAVREDRSAHGLGRGVGDPNVIEIARRLA